MLLQSSSVVRLVAARQVHVSPLSAAYVTKGARDGVVPTMLREILGARIMIKTAMKHTKSKVSTEPHREVQCDVPLAVTASSADSGRSPAGSETCRQRHLWIHGCQLQRTNAMRRSSRCDPWKGTTLDSSGWVSFIYLSNLQGRETLERAIERVHSGDYEGAKVIYGDTDSMFVLMKGRHGTITFYFR